MKVPKGKSVTIGGRTWKSGTDIPDRYFKDSKEIDEIKKLLDKPTKKTKSEKPPK